MSEWNDSGANGVDRRSILKRAGSASTFSLVGATTAAAGDDASNGEPAADGERVLNEVTLDTSGHDQLARASVTFLERGDRAVIRERVRTTRDLVGRPGARGRGGTATRSDGRPTKTSVSISMGPDSGAASVAQFADSEFVSELDASQIDIESDETEVEPGDQFDRASADGTGDAAASGVPDEPEFGSDWDGVAFVETNSSECGTLCRTNLVMNFDWSRGRRSIDDSTAALENVDGAACEGDEFGDRFPCWSTPLYDCSVPETFNTHWHAEDREYGTSWAEASYHNSDFPLIPNTYADHYVRADVRNDGVGVYDYSVEHSATTGFEMAANYLLKSSYGAILY